MKKNLGRIIGIILIFILGYHQFVYADVIDPTDALFTPLAFLGGFIGVIVLIVSAISFFSLKATVKKQNTPGYDKEKLATLTDDDIEKKRKK